MSKTGLDMDTQTARTTRKLPSNEILNRYGITRRTLGRWMADPDLGFPKPLTLNGRHYFDLAEVESYEKRAAVQIAAA